MRPHREAHRIHRIGWLRAAVLGANDGIVSTGSLIVGVAAAAQDRDHILIAGLAGLVAGAMSMAAGEYVSVSSQSDAERADVAREKAELAEQPEQELEELSRIYAERGVSPDLARAVARELMQKDALDAHARDELGILELTAAKPLQAAMTSAATFAAGAALPLAAGVLAPGGGVVVAVTATSLVALAVLGLVGARAGGATGLRPVARVVFWGAAAMAVTAAIGALFGVAA